jgi:hypothetical protein
MVEAVAARSDDGGGVERVGARRSTRWTARQILLIVFGTALIAACGGGTDEAGTTDGDTTPTVESTTTLPGDTTSSSPPDSSTTSIESCATVLSLDCAGADVLQLQRLLKTRGYGRLTRDGRFGQQTAGALARFENDCATCTRDLMIEIDGAEWNELESRPVTDPDEPS